MLPTSTLSFARAQSANKKLDKAQGELDECQAALDRMQVEFDAAMASSGDSALARATASDLSLAAAATPSGSELWRGTLVGTSAEMFGPRAGSGFS